MSEPPIPKGDRTVFQRSMPQRPNPGGRRPTPSAPAEPPATPYSGGAPYNPPRTPPAPPGNTGGNNAEDWIRSAAQTPEPPPQQSLILKRDVPVAANDNALLEAAGPILLLLGRLRVSLMRANFTNLMAQVQDAIKEFEQKVRGSGASDSQARQGVYALCATADDIVQNIPTEDRRDWVQYSMLSHFFQIRTSGVGFFEELERAKADAVANYDVLELMYACLALGFQGVHRTSAGGASQLQAIQRNLYELLRRTRSTTDADLSPHWRGQDIPATNRRSRVPLWAVCAVAAVLLFGLYVLLRSLLSGDASVVVADTSHLFSGQPISVTHLPVPAGPPPPPPCVQCKIEPVRPTQLERIRAVLVQEIGNHAADAIENGASIIIRVEALTTFPSGSATALDSFGPVGTKIAEALTKEPGDIRIIGHTDNEPIATVQFPSNYELSIARARAVAAVLKPGIQDQARIKIDGKADTQPIAPNGTEDGRARNRRVEISIPREETLRQQ